MIAVDPPLELRTQDTKGVHAMRAVVLEEARVRTTVIIPDTQIVIPADVMCVEEITEHGNARTMFTELKCMGEKTTNSQLLTNTEPIGRLSPHGNILERTNLEMTLTRSFTTGWATELTGGVENGLSATGAPLSFVIYGKAESARRQKGKAFTASIPQMKRSGR